MKTKGVLYPTRSSVRIISFFKINNKGSINAR
nr:MAG TPA: hypothetical protein [Caudoviricetes sp.]